MLDGGGADTIDGGDGDDTLRGGAGDDTLTGAPAPTVPAVIDGRNTCDAERTERCVLPVATTTTTTTDAGPWGGPDPIADPVGQSRGTAVGRPS